MCLMECTLMAIWMGASLKMLYWQLVVVTFVSSHEHLKHARVLALQVAGPAPLAGEAAGRMCAYPAIACLLMLGRLRHLNDCS